LSCAESALSKTHHPLPDLQDLLLPEAQALYATMDGHRSPLFVAQAADQVFVLDKLSADTKPAGGGGTESDDVLTGTKPGGGGGTLAIF
jgi:hypothetical protein